MEILLNLHRFKGLNMDKPFVYDKYVTGKNFIGRKKECNILGNLLEAGENVYLYGPRKSGKTSLIQQTLFDMRMAGKTFPVAHVELRNVRTIEDFLLRFANAVIRPLYSTQNEYREVISKYLEGTHFIFDPDRFATANEAVSINWAIDQNDIEQMLRLPSRIAKEKAKRFFVIISDFQNLMFLDRHEDVFAVLEKIFSEREYSDPSVVSFILSGSKVNAMKYIFEEKKYFYRRVEKLSLEPVDEREIIEYIVRGFMISGKVIERDLIMGVCRLFKSEMWYLNHFMSICDSMSKGYMNEGIVMAALDAVIAVHEPRFLSMVDDLTDHQLSLLKATLDGVVRFSAADVIEAYSLNSSANVRRVKDALKKKEILTFTENDVPVVIDPLFQYWVKKYYFEY